MKKLLLIAIVLALASQVFAGPQVGIGIQLGVPVPVVPAPVVPVPPPAPVVPAPVVPAYPYYGYAPYGYGYYGPSIGLRFGWGGRGGYRAAPQHRHR